MQYGLIGYFEKQQSKGKLYIHDNFDYVTKADLILKNGHVAIATGKVRVDKNNNVTSFEVIESKGGAGVEKNWYDVGETKDRGYMIYHPFRKSDEVRKYEDIPLTPDRESISTYNEYLDRTKDNLNQKVVNK